MTRSFRGATFNVQIRRNAGASGISVVVDGRKSPGNRLGDLEPGRTYQVDVEIPA